MAKKTTELDVLVLGDHPSAYLAAAILGEGGKLRVGHTCWPTQSTDPRLVLVNPALFSLHKLLGPMRRKLPMTGAYGAQFLADDPEQRSEHRDPSILAYITSQSELRTAFRTLAEQSGVTFYPARTVEVAAPDVSGVGLTLGRTPVHPRALIVAERPAAEVGRTLGIPEPWSAEVMHRYSYVLLERPQWLETARRPVVPMSLDLDGTLAWGWMLIHEQCVQLSVVQSREQAARTSPQTLLRHWSKVLTAHQVTAQELEFTERQVRSVEMPLAGALEQEAVADRTLLIGPAGGFFTASAEQVYPACWSAIYAAEVMKKAVRDEPLQDALQGYRSKWRTTLGDYLRGPQQNLRFLLPLVYRNPIMTTRLVESILAGKSVVR